jgi:hypothetical protein
LDDVFERLSMAFIDEIDPSFSNGDQLQDIHDGKAIPASDKFIGT